MEQSRGSQLLPRVYEILVILASKYMGLMGDSGASVRDSAVILQSVAGPSETVLGTTLYSSEKLPGNLQARKERDF